MTEQDDVDAIATFSVNIKNMPRDKLEAIAIQFFTDLIQLQRQITKHNIEIEKLLEDDTH